MKNNTRVILEMEDYNGITITLSNFHHEFGKAIMTAKNQKELDSICLEFKIIAANLGIK